MLQPFLPATLLFTMVNELSAGIIVLKKEAANDFYFFYLNDYAKKLYWLDPQASILGQPLSSQMIWQDPSVLERLQRAYRSSVSQSFEQLIRKDASGSDTELWYQIKTQRHDDYLVLLVEDISKRKRFEAHIHKLAFQDELTGLYNRRYFLSRTPQLLSLAKRFQWSCGLLYFDLNGFKEINDTLGHSAGDEVLKQIAWRLSKLSREQDILFRSGGDEFALFLPQTSESCALKTAQRIAQTFDESIEISGQALRPGASIGIAVLPSSEAHVDSLLERADSAMYLAKERKELEHVPIQLWTPG
ncbi:MAG: GGDEF domain-containing protein [Trueperaceae bacterium]|nr:GGDEF domain-containing protein [Trueperaceae bacterium]